MNHHTEQSVVNDREVIEKAAEWHATLTSGEATQDEREACNRWRNAHPANEEAYQKLYALSHRFDCLSPEMRKPVGSVLNEVLKEDTVPVTSGFKATVLVLTFLVVSILGVQSLTSSSLAIDYHTSVGERRSITLSDGTQLILNTDSAVKLAFDDYERRLLLPHGEILVEVAHDPTRPFVIETSQGTARALGTRYSVRTLDDVMDVVVTESKVEVCRSESSSLDSPSCVTTHQGEMARVHHNSVEWSQHHDTFGSTAWSQGRLVVDEWPLPRVLEELKRYRPGIMHFNADDLADIKVSGVFPLDDTEQTLDILSQNLPVQVNRFTRFITLVRKLQTKLHLPPD
ncbi:FecR family protein [Hahella ganghwensis]|uniref:FecR family protein n=1 Tax=Hahella ganghwensis TaxID=286420 RepID=UPI00035F08DC|nr:FecR family protein [Hahella ganghwensis]